MTSCHPFRPFSTISAVIHLLIALALTLRLLPSAAALVTTSISMVEGHSVHRIASRFRSKLVGRKFAASSPNGRFVEGAAAIDGRVLSRMEAVGKNLFAFFSSDATMSDNVGVGSDQYDEDVVVVHVHFGMSGVWALFDKSSDEEPEVKPTTRLRLEEIANRGKSTTATSRSECITHLSAMTVAHGTHSIYSAKKATLGQDPLRSDADPDTLYSKITKSKKSVGQLLMDQSYFAGPGNIYRAEILFLAGVYPTLPGMNLDRPSFDRIWNTSVSLLRRGYDTGSILTVDPEVDPSVASKGERRYIYNKSKCARCGGEVSSWDMNGRTCYACESGKCQPKIKIEPSSNDSPRKVMKRKKKKVGKRENVKAEREKGKMKKEKQPRQHVPFISHCAPISCHQRLEQGGAEQLTIAEIRSVMEQIIGEQNESLDNDVVLPPKSARKAVQVEALNNLLLEQKTAQKKDSKGATSVKSEPLPPPLVSAEEAAREKAVNGENRAVEHVAELSREQAVRAISVTPSPASKKRDRRDRADGKSGDVTVKKEEDRYLRTARRRRKL